MDGVTTERQEGRFNGDSCLSYIYMNDRQPNREVSTIANYLLIKIQIFSFQRK